MRRLEMTRLAYGALLLSSPDAVARAVGAGRLDGRDRLVARILGARHVGQALVTSHSGPQLGRLWPAVDLLHAASMVALAVLDPRRRRVAAADAVVASLFTLGGAMAVEAHAGPGTGPD